MDVLENFLTENGETSSTIADARAELAQLRAELEAKTKAVDEIRQAVEEGDVEYLKLWLTAHPAKEGGK